MYFPPRASSSACGLDAGSLSHRSVAHVVDLDSIRDENRSLCTFETRLRVTVGPQRSDLLALGFDQITLALQHVEGRRLAVLEANALGAQLLGRCDAPAFGRFDATETVFSARVIDVFADTFSRVDPAHTPFLGNAEQGDWIGLGGSRAFEAGDSLTVSIEDADGMATATVELFFRHDDGTGPAVANQVWTAWESKAMDLSIPDIFHPGEGDYRMIFPRSLDRYRFRVLGNGVTASRRQLGPQYVFRNGGRDAEAKSCRGTILSVGVAIRRTGVS